MRLDGLPPRLLLLVALAGWALLAWMLALAGMGGRVVALPDDPALQQALPQPPAAVPERLGPEADYALIGSQSLFSDTRTPPPFVLNDDKADAPPAFEFLLTSVILTPRLKMAIIQPADGSPPVRMKLDESPEGAKGWRLVELQPRSAVFEGPEGRRELPLRTWGGEPAPKDDVAATAASPQAPATGTATPAAAAPASPPARPEFTPPPQTAAQAQAAKDEAARIEDIRRRIEARRAQVQQSLQAPPATPAPPPSAPPNRNP
jgi:general secretion pathway protein N